MQRGDVLIRIFGPVIVVGIRTVVPEQKLLDPIDCKREFVHRDGFQCLR